MREFKLCCPYCDQHVLAPEEMLGTDVGCPRCEREFRLPDEREIDEQKRALSARKLTACVCGAEAPAQAL
jgi:hypothetical protein